MCAENPSVSSEGGWFMGNNCILNDRKKTKKERSYRRHPNIYSPLIYRTRTITLLLLLLLLSSSSLLLHLCNRVYMYSCWL